MPDLLGEKITGLILNCEGDQLTKPNRSKQVHEDELQFVSTNLGLYVQDTGSFSVSSHGNQVFGCFIVYGEEYNIGYKLVRQAFGTNSVLFYNFEHRIPITSIEVSEQHNLAMSGECDELLVLHNLTSGSTIKTFAMNHQVTCLLSLGSVLAIAEENVISFLDLETKKMKHSDLFKKDFKMISHFESKLKEDPSNGQRQLTLLVGRKDSNRIQLISLPESIVKLKISSKQKKKILILKQTFEDFERKISHYKKVNKYLSSELKRVRQNL